MAGNGKPLVIDGDGHVMEPATLWAERMDHKKWGDLIPRLVSQEEGVWVGNTCRGGGLKVMKKLADDRGMTLEELMAPTAKMIAEAGGFDPHERIKVMDRDGMDAAIIYPSTALFFGPVDPIEAFHNDEFVLDCQRAYNEWLSDFCKVSPRRLFGLAAVPLQNIDLAIAEAERAVNQLGLKGVFIRPSAYIDELPFSHNVYDRFWAACQDLDIPIALHPGVHIDTPGACRLFRLVRESPCVTDTNSNVDPIYGGSGLGQAVGNAVDMIVSMGRLLMGGVCERFPKLNFIFLESGGGWTPTQLERMDEQVETFWLERRWLKLLPSEYFKRQCYVSFDPGEWNLVACAEFLGPDRVIWASDFPHPEYRTDVISKLKSKIGGLSEEAQQLILGRNAAKVYRLPL
ncbi:MAG TPA: amidohydrolase family protein [Candidatus Binataceae bacterium]